MSAFAIHTVAAAIRWPLSQLVKRSRLGGPVQSILALSGFDVTGLRAVKEVA